jgi:hypothetical protein
MEKITIKFDMEAGILNLEFCHPHKGQGSTEMAGDD